MSFARCITAAMLCVASFSTALLAEEPYHELYRPQYHFTPSTRWIGDPSGLLYFDGKYHAYWWGATESDDMVHWVEVSPFAVKDMPANTSTFTGSVVVDHNGTAGYGDDAFIAAFTAYDRESKKQSQSIAFSLDGGREFHYYDLNPVVDLWSTEFRDPTVIWYEPTQEWVMVVAKALEKKVKIYTSKNLKEWTWVSDFGPWGDSMRSWECPDLFQLDVENVPGEKKWVMLVSINWEDEQYFVGDFDGKSFTTEQKADTTLYVDHGLDYYASRTFQNFGKDDDPNKPNDVHSLGWVATWDYAQLVPSTYGKGMWSIPRKMTLRKTDNDGYILVQRPAEALKSLRGKPMQYNKTVKPGITPIKGVGDYKNVYEADVKFKPTGEGKFGLNLCVGDGRKFGIEYDPKSEYLFIDRVNVNAEPIDKFARTAYAHVAPNADGTIDMRIFVDKSSLEVFTEDGAKVFSALTYQADDQVDVEVFSLQPSLGVEATFWPLESIHN